MPPVAGGVDFRVPSVPAQRTDPAAWRARIQRFWGAAWVWVAAAASSLLVALGTHIGPVVLTLSASHGVHVGDLVAVMVTGGVATITTVGRLRASGVSRSRGGQSPGQR